MLKGSIYIDWDIDGHGIHAYTYTVHASCTLRGYVHSLLCTTVSIVYSEEH